jgi:uncharacterized protein (DUF1810 family)
VTDELDRFRVAQAGSYQEALEEIRAGRKQSHWMWFIFPQMRGLGHSAMSHEFGIADLDEARVYLADPELGGRLREICSALLIHRGTPAQDILGAVDAAKLCSSATLFREAGGGVIFDAVLEAFCEGQPCAATLRLLHRSD